MPKTHLIRVKPGEELLTQIKAYCERRKIRSAVITHIIGSFSSVKLGFLKVLPGKYITKEIKGPLEIVACQGTIGTMAGIEDRRRQESPSSKGELVLHIHGLVSDENKSIGGHINQAIIFSTAEVFIEETDFPIKRYLDSYTGLRELVE